MAAINRLEKFVFHQLGLGKSGFPDFPFNNFLAADNILFAHLFFEPLADFGSRRSAFDDFQPVAARPMNFFRSQNFNNVPIFQFIG